MKLVTDCCVIKLRSFLAQKAAVPLVGAEGDKCRRREISFLVRSQVDRVEGQLSRDSIAICKGKVLKSTQNVATENTIPRFWEMF